MPFIPHTKQDIQAMLKTIGANSIEDLFDEIPKELENADISGVPAGLTEMEASRLLHARAAQDSGTQCFIGAGAYEHHIPAAVWEVTTRGEFMTAYTPYQAEASQGTLQLLYEYQTMMASLTGMDVSNASLYDGASALAEAILMAMRANKKSTAQRVLIPRSLHPHYRQVVQGIVGQHEVEIIEIAFDAKSGVTPLAALAAYKDQDITALVIPQPNFFGSLEDVDALTDWAYQKNALVIGVVNPLALALLKPPGAWGKQGADIACGEGQPLGIPLASGGPYYGFLCCKQALVRQLPGRLIGRTTDKDGKEGFVLTLQAREQHIRRAKATSNICTNQGLMVTATTIYMSILGPVGLRRVALACHAQTKKLCEKLTAISGVELAFTQPKFHEAVLRLPKPVAPVLEALAKLGILGGYDLSATYPELGNCLLVCATETKTDQDLCEFASQLASVLGNHAGQAISPSASQACCN